jgi:Flp pilus assembly protein TadG
VELVILAPGILVLLSLAIVAGRIEVAAGAVEQASAAAARAASLARTPAAANQAARTVASTSLSGQNLHCSTLDVTVETAGFAVRVGQPAQVAANVACAVDLAAVAVPGMPGSTTLSSRSVSVLDQYRSRAAGPLVADPAASPDRERRR